MASLETLQPGQRVIYFTGPSLACIRQGVKVAAADAAWAAALRGAVFLTQRKLDSGEYAYVAIGRRRIDPCPVKAIMSDAPSFRRRAAA